MLVASFVSSSAKMLIASVWTFQQSGAQWNPGRVWGDMQWPARSVVAILFLMSAWSIGVMIDRWIAYRAARKQSLQFAPMIAGALRQGNLDEAIRVGVRSKKSHLAKVVTSGLVEFRGLGAATEIPEDHIAASKRALERAEAIVYAEMERGLSGLATIGSTAPFVG